MHFELYRVTRGKLAGQWRWRLRAGNGEIIAHGESYKRQSSCRAAIFLVSHTDSSTIIEVKG